MNNFNETQTIEVNELEKTKEVLIESEQSTGDDKETKIETKTSVAQYFTEEYKRSTLFFWITTVILSIPAICAIVYIGLKAKSASEWYYFLLPTIILIGLLGFIGKNFFNYKLFKRDMSIMKEGMTTEGIPPSITRLYKNLQISIINLNWFSIGFYVYGGLFIFLLHIFGGMGTSKGEGINIVKWAEIKYIYWVSFGTMAFVFANHVFMLIARMKKINKICSFYGYNIISEGEMTIIKQTLNRRNFKVTLFLLLIIVLVPIWIGKKIIGK